MAAIDASDIAATLATYSRTIGDLDVGRRGAHGAPGSPTLVGGWTATGALPRNGQPASADGDGPGAPEGPPVGLAEAELRAWITEWLARRLQVPASQIETARSFADHGMDSVAAVELAAALSNRLGKRLDETLLWDYPTVDALIHALVPGTPELPAPSPSDGRLGQQDSSSKPTLESQLDDEISRLEEELRSRS
jgi:acyl carrier protein